MRRTGIKMVSGLAASALVVVLCVARCAADNSPSPPYTDYCQLLARDIQDEHYGFVAGNKLYYVAGSFGADWHEYWESETLGFTHPMFRDGRARGHGIVTADPGGTGHDNWGWEFWRKTKVAYGTAYVDSQAHRHPKPTATWWRPDGLVCEYQVGDAKIREQKFISRSDVLCDILEANRDVEIRFEGQSFFNTEKIPTFDGDPPGTRFSQECNSTMRYVAADNALHLIERGTCMVKPYWQGKARKGRMQYDGLSFLISATVPLLEVAVQPTEAGNLAYSFALKIPANTPVALAYAVDEDYPAAHQRLQAVLAAPAAAQTAKTREMNDLLNRQLPYFRCSDPLAVKTYYYLWALYFMYFTDIGEGWEQYPHTQTAVNNFMGLHLWDSWAYIQAGSWVADKWRWGHGNALQWQHMVPFKNKANCLPDTFGKAWYSATCRMVFVGATEPAWQQYRRSGDRRYLREVYDKLFKPLYWDNGGPTPSFGADLNALDCLVAMARELGETADLKHWQEMRPGKLRNFKAQWSGRWAGFYGARSVPWKDIWALESLQCVDLPNEWARQMVDEYVLDTDKGFCSPVGVNTRAADSPPNGIFRCSTISSWLAIDGMFRQHCDYAGMLVTVNHLKAMVREWGYPVAPEAWNDKFKAWGSRYYNWDIAIVLPLLEWLAGIDYSVPDHTFTVAPHLPPTWDFIETYTPVVLDGRTHWVHARVERTAADGNYRQRISVAGNPLKSLVIAPYTEDRQLLSAEGTGEQRATDAGPQFHSEGSAGQATLLLGAKTKVYKTLAWVTPRCRFFYGQTTVAAENLIPGTVLRYTTNGRDPQRSSPSFDEPVTLDRTTTLKLRAFGADGAQYSPYTVQYTATELTPPVTPTALHPGLRYALYELPENPTALPDFPQLKPVRTGVVPPALLKGAINVTEIAKDRPDHFALHLSGYLNLPADQVYNFLLRADDGARLLIDGKRVVELNTHCAVDPWEQEGYIGLRQGYHRLDLFYYQDQRHRKLFVKSRSGDEAIRHPLPADALYY